MFIPQELEKAIDKTGVKKSFIIEKLGISKTAFYKKFSGKSEWRKSEIYVLVDILRLTGEEVEKIFYSKVDL